MSRDMDTDLAADVVIIPVPPGFAHQEELKRIARLLADILSSQVISEREIVKRLIRHHPAVDGI